MNIRIIPYKLIFHKPAGTSRGILTAKESWYFILSQKEKPDIYGIGECSLLPGLSPELHHNIYEIFRRLESDPEAWLENTSLTSSFPAIRFALETAYLDWQNEGKRILSLGHSQTGKKQFPLMG